MDPRLIPLAIGTFAIGTDAYVFAGLLPRVAQSLDISVGAAGQLVSAYAFVYALLTPVAAALTTRWPRRHVLLSGLAVFIAGNLLTAAAAAFSLALAGRAVAGLGAAMFTPAASATAAMLVTPERRGRALAVVLAGLSGATALGAPIGTVIGSVADWRSALWYVAALAVAAALGVRLRVPGLTGTPAPRLRERLAPLADPRIAAALATTFLAMLGVFLVYTYLSLVLDRATGGRGTLLAALMATWGVAAMLGTLRGGGLADRLGSRRIINSALGLLALDFALMPWAAASFAGAALALAFWGACGWGFVVAQQHRLVGIAPSLAAIVLALNASAIYLAVSASGAAGAVILMHVDPHRLPLLGSALLLGAAALAELAHRSIDTHAAPGVSASSAK